MADDIEIQLPKLGESILSATVVRWFKKEGDAVERDEALLEVATDKVNSEIPSPSSGILKARLVSENEEIEVGAPLAILTVQQSVEQTVLGKASIETPQTVATASCTPSSARQNHFLSPALLQLAQQEGVPLDILTKLPGTGGGGRVTKKDLEIYLKGNQETAPLISSETPPLKDQAIKMVGLRKAVADVMVRSHKEIPSAALVQEVDVTELLKYIAEEKERFLKKEGAKLTITSFLIKALAQTLPAFPYLNATADAENIYLKNEINIGFAVGLQPSGILVPILKKCDGMSLAQIAKDVFRLSQKAKEGQLIPEEVKGGTITVTNFGMAGALMGLPIIRHPEAAIIGVGAIVKTLKVMRDESLAIRSTLHLTLCFDHRVVDGLYACNFLEQLKENFQKAHLI